MFVIFYLVHRHVLAFLLGGLIYALLALLSAEAKHLHPGVLAQHAVDLLIDQGHALAQLLIVKLVFVGRAFPHRFSLLVNHDSIFDFIQGA